MLIGHKPYMLEELSETQFHFYCTKILFLQTIEMHYFGYMIAIK